MASSRSVLVVGAGLSGATLAQQAAQAGHQVTILERRSHLAGNCYDEQRAGILVSLYGAHLFHTNSQRVWQYLQDFATWRTYQHRVLVKVGNKLVPLPVNINTINQLFELNLQTAAEMRQFLAGQVQSRPQATNGRDYLLTQLGPQLYRQIFRDYSRKQWSRDPSQLDPSIFHRLPLRFNKDDRYFTDRYQALPVGGYTQLVKQLLDHPQIKVSLQSDFFALSDQERQSFDQIFYTGPLDRYFAYDLGHLEYRSLRFRFTRYQTSAKKPHYQLNSVINFPDAKVAFTRRIEYKWLNPPARPLRHTIVAREYPSSQGEPYYPVPRPVNQRLAAAYMKRVKTLAQQQIYFAGRLATYRYLNMDQAIAEALQLAKKVF